MSVTELAPAPAFVSVILVNLSNLSAWLQVVTLAIGCVVSTVMLVAWWFKAKREHSTEKLAELILKEAEQKARGTLEIAEVKAEHKLVEAEHKAEDRMVSVSPSEVCLSIGCQLRK